MLSVQPQQVAANSKLLCVMRNRGGISGTHDPTSFSNLVKFYVVLKTTLSALTGANLAA
eukprot:COSAG02_NODE_6617_length_3455_cov_16.752384_4_plen_59_part_00